MIRRWPAAAALVLAGATIMVAPASMADESIKLTVSPDRIQIAASTNRALSTAVAEVRVTTTVPVHITVAMVDVVSDEAGNWQKTRHGSTSYTLSGALSIDPVEIFVTPRREEQKFPVTLSIPTAKMTRPLAGIIVVTLAPSGNAPADGTSFDQGLEIDTPVVAEPAPATITGASDVRASLGGTGLIVEPSESMTIIDELVPDFVSGLVDHGPVATVAQYTNNGDFIVDAQTTFDFATVGPAAMFRSDDPGDVFYTLNDANHYALPGQPAVAKGTSMVETNGASVDTLPFIGFVKVTATTTGTLGPLAAAPVVQSTVFLVFPWKEALALLLVITLWVLFKRWRRNRKLRPTDGPAPAADIPEHVDAVT